MRGISSLLLLVHAVLTAVIRNQHSLISDDFSTDPRRLAWVHFPKAGTSFLNTLSHWLDEAHCLPSYAAVPSCTPKSQSDLCYQFGLEYEDLMSVFSIIYPPFFWAGPDRIAADMNEGERNFHCHGVAGEPGVVVLEPLIPNSTAAWWGSTCALRGHRNVSQGLFDQWQGDFVAMFRNPVDRVISNYAMVYDNSLIFHDLDLSTRCAVDYAGAATGMSLLEYAKVNAGLTVKMLAGQQVCLAHPTSALGVRMQSLHPGSSARSNLVGRRVWLPLNLQSREYTTGVSDPHRTHIEVLSIQ